MKPMSDRDDYKDILVDKRLRLLATVNILSFIIPLLFSSFTIHSTFVIASNSMTPTLMQGDLVLALPRVDEITNGTIIVFQSPFGGFEVHRVEEVKSIEGNIYYKTKGDANNQTDSFLVSRERVVGQVNYIIPKLGTLFLIPREIMLLAAISLTVFYLFLTYTSKGELNQSKLTNQIKENIGGEKKEKIFQTCCVISILILTNVLNSSASVKLTYSSSPNTTSLTSPKVVLQNGIVGSSIIYDNGISANVNVKAWLSSWKDRRIISIDHNDVTSPLSNFPILVHLSGSSGISSADVTSIFNEVGSDSKKIALTTSDGITQCYVEIEEWVYPLTSATETLRPNAAGDETGISSVLPAGSSHWSVVDEVTANGATDYVYTSSSSYQRDLYNLPSPTGSGTINNVVVYFRFAPSSGVTSYARAAIKTHGAVYLGSQETQSAFAWVTKSYSWTSNPYTSSSWTWTEIDDLQAGLELKNSGGGLGDCTQVYVEVNYVPPGGEAWLWVKVPSVSSSDDTELYLYYDKDHVDNTNYVGDTGSTPAQNVWDSDYQGVWHLKENPTGTAPPIKDSTSNNNGGTSAGSMTSSDQVAGQIDGSLDFDGSNDEITCGNEASLQITAALTIEAWAKTSSTGAIRGIVNKEVSSYNGYQLRKYSDNKYRFAIGDPSLHYAASNSAYTDSNWHYIVGVKSTTNYLYMDGVQQANTFTRSITDSGANFDIGRAYSNYDGYWWNGQIDEVRVSNVARSAAWIKASYESGRDDLLDFGTEETYQLFSYDYVLKVVNQVSQAWKVNLQVYDSSGLSRISSATISFHDGSASDQIIVNGGAITQSEGLQYDLSSSSTICISISDLQASTTGTSYLFVYLKAKNSDSGVYTLYEIVLRID